MPKASVDSIYSCINSIIFPKLWHPPNRCISLKILRILLTLPHAILGSHSVLTYRALSSLKSVLPLDFQVSGSTWACVGQLSQKPVTEDSSFVLSSEGHQSPNHVYFTPWFSLEWSVCIICPIPLLWHSFLCQGFGCSISFPQLPSPSASGSILKHSNFSHISFLLQLLHGSLLPTCYDYMEPFLWYRKSFNNWFLWTSLVSSLSLPSPAPYL